MNVTFFMNIAQFLLTLGNLSIMAYAFSKFLSKPHDSLEERVTSVELRLAEVERTNVREDEEMKQQRKNNKVIQDCLLALIDFELTYCLDTHYEHTEDLKRARSILHNHLTEE